MGKYFGTDGIRGKYGDNLDADLAYKVGLAIVAYFGKGAVVAAAVAVFDATASVYAVFGGLCLAAMLSVAAAGIAAHKSVRSYRPLDVTYEPYAEITEERDARKSAADADNKG